MLKLKIEMVKTQSNSSMVLVNDHNDISFVLFSFENAKLDSLEESYKITYKNPDLEFYPICGFSQNRTANSLVPIKDFILKMKIEFDKIDFLIGDSLCFTRELGVKIQEQVSIVNGQYDLFLNIYRESCQTNIENRIKEITSNKSIQFKYMNILEETLKKLVDNVDVKTQMLILDSYEKIAKFKGGDIHNSSLIRINVDLNKKAINVDNSVSPLSSIFYDFLVDLKLNEYECISNVMDLCNEELLSNIETFDQIVESIGELSLDEYIVGSIKPECIPFGLSAGLSFDE
jgi:hypothetical protein